MKRSMTFGAALIMGLTFIAGPAVAQMNSIPVMFNPKGGTGVMFALDFGKGMNAESGKNTAVAFRSALGIGPITIGGGIGIANPVGLTGRGTETQYMGNFAMRMFGGGLLPVSISLQGGVGVLDNSDIGLKAVTVPIGLGIGFSLPTPGFSFDPWFAPRYTMVRNKSDLFTETATQSGLGFSAGLNMNFLMGVGLHIAGDWQSNPLKAVTSGAGTFTVPATKPFVFGIGLNYTFTIPGVPMVPMI